jgi:hypothetical protein
MITYLCSKEIYVMEHEYYSGISLAIMAVYAVKKLGPKIAAYCDKEIDVCNLEIVIFSFNKILTFRGLKVNGARAVKMS